MALQHLSVLRQDVRLALRNLRRTPAATATAVLTLALGVGATTAVFSVVHAVLLRPLPYPRADSLVELFEENVSTGSVTRASALNYLAWAERSRSFDAVAAFGTGSLTLTEERDPAVVDAGFVTASLFRVLAVPPVIGRTLLPEDERRGAPKVVVLGESIWRARFGGDERAVGRSISVDGVRRLIVGVMPQAFREVGRARAAGTPRSEMFVPLTIDPAIENRGNHTLRAVGRMRAGVTIAQARDEMRAVAAGLQDEFPGTNRNWTVRMEPLASTTVEPAARRSLLLMLGAVLLVFAIASANVANLMLARGATRRAELAVRAALGAGRGRLVRLLVTEGAVLALASGTAGLIAASLAMPVIRGLLPPVLPGLDELRLDVSVLVFGVIVTMFSGIVFGAMPALVASRGDLSRSLLAGRATGTAPRAWARHALIVGQISLATTLLTGATVLLDSFLRLQRVPLGFDPDSVLTARISLPRGSYPDANHAGQFYDAVLTKLRLSGDLQAAAIGTSAPFAPGVRVTYQPLPGVEAAAWHIVSGDYFRALGIPLRAGRSFGAQDRPQSPPVAVVSEGLARVLWPDTAAIGHVIDVDGRSSEVVGVVGDVRGSDIAGSRGGGPDRAPRRAVYFSAEQLPQRTMTLVLRPNQNAGALAPAIREAVRGADPLLPLQQVRPLRDWLAESLGPTQITTLLAAIFAGSALLLAAVGIYGVLAYLVASRAREIGVRMAIGATSGHVIALVLRQGMAWTAGGIAIGVAAALAAASVLSPLLFEVPVRDPATYVVVGAVVAAVAALACSIPAARAVRVDPTTAMRAE